MDLKKARELLKKHLSKIETSNEVTHPVRIDVLARIIPIYTVREIFLNP